MFSVRGEAYRDNKVTVSGKGLYGIIFINVPYLYGHIIRTRCDETAVRAEVNGFYGFRMANKGFYFLSGFSVPEFYRVIIRS